MKLKDAVRQTSQYLIILGLELWTQIIALGRVLIIITNPRASVNLAQIYHVMLGSIEQVAPRYPTEFASRVLTFQLMHTL